MTDWKQLEGLAQLLPGVMDGLEEFLVHWPDQSHNRIKKINKISLKLDSQHFHLYAKLLREEMYHKTQCEPT